MNLNRMDFAVRGYVGTAHHDPNTPLGLRHWIEQRGGWRTLARFAYLPDAINFAKQVSVDHGRARLHGPGRHRSNYVAGRLA